MKIKRYIGETNQEAISKVRDDLGRDAIIINTRKMRRRGIRGLFSRPLVEVVATIDDYTNSTTLPSNITTEEISKKVPDEKVRRLEAQVNSVEGMVKSLVEEISVNNLTMLVNDKDKLTEQLINTGVKEEFAIEVTSKAKKLSSETNLDIKTSLNSIMCDIVKDPKPIEIANGEQKVLLYIGPTGVGKTTTLAKMAAIFSIKQDLNVGLITTDTFRIAAIDQLKIYADILDIPLSIIYSPNEISKALVSYKNKDIILIDTAGRGLKDAEHEDEVKDLISRVSPSEVYLVISANMSYESCKKVIQRYDFIKDYKIIFTKLDDVDNYAIIFNCCMLSNKPLSYITDGQNVPDDIKVADTSSIIGRVLESVNI